jgi:hypothetical protein
MVRISELGIELKSGIFFCITALVLSIIAGLAGKVPGGMIFFRSLVIIPVFFGVGFGVVMILKKFVPEIYELITNLKQPKEEIQQQEIIIDTPPDDSGESSEKPDQEFSEFTEKDYDRLQTINDSGLESSFHSSDGKLGKHVIVESQMSGYEPKVIAQAIRTMMSKDKD